jgi:hypothetical protein
VQIPAPEGDLIGQIGNAVDDRHFSLSPGLVVAIVSEQGAHIV